MIRLPDTVIAAPWLRGAALVLLGSGGALLAAPAPAVLGETHVLPEFVVTERAELPAPDPWLHGALPGWRVMSTASPRQTRALLERVLLFDAAVRLVWPLVEPGKGPELQLVVCGRKGDFARFAEAAKTPLPESGRVSLLLPGNPAVLVVDAYTRELPIMPMSFNPLARVASLSPFSKASDEPEEGEVVADDAEPFTDGTGTAVDLVRQVCREYVRHVLSHSKPRLPAWAEEGIAQILSHGEVAPRSITFGRLIPASQTEPGDDVQFHHALKHQELIPFGRFFATARDDAAVTNPIGSVWAQQAYAFAHLCLYGEKGKHAAGFVRLVQRASQGPVTEEVFRECFGVGFRQMEKTLDAYILFPRFNYARLTLGKDAGLAPAAPPELRDASADEVGLYVGGALERAGQHAAALREWRLAYARGAKDVELLTRLAEEEFRAGRTKRALELSEKAVVGASTSPAPYLAVVRAKLAAWPEVLSIAHVRDALRLLFAARQNAAPSAEVYRAIAEVWQRSEIVPAPKHLAVLHEGIAEFPNDTELRRAVANLEKRAGRDASASSVQSPEREQSTLDVAR